MFFLLRDIPEAIHSNLQNNCFSMQGHYRVLPRNFIHFTMFFILSNNKNQYFGPKFLK